MSGEADGSGRSGRASAGDGHAGQGGYDGPPWYPPHRCMWCGAHIEDPGLGFVLHANDNPDCFIQWQDWRNNMRREHGGS